MKVSELIAKLEESNPNLEVVISTDVRHVTLGGSPRVEVANVEEGFDWNSGAVFLHPPIGTNLVQCTREEWRQLLEWKQLVSSVRGHAALKEAKENFIHKEELREYLEGVILKHFTATWYPSCEESIFQCDTPMIESPSVVAEIMTKFDLYKSKEEQE